MRSGERKRKLAYRQSSLSQIFHKIAENKQKSSKEGTGGMDKLKILVVDDERRMRKLVRDFLVREGYEVLEAGDGDEALDIFYSEKNIALLILDVMMPGRGGFRSVGRFVKIPRCRSLC